MNEASVRRPSLCPSEARAAPDPYMEALKEWGLPWKESFEPELVE